MSEQDATNHEVFDVEAVNRRDQQQPLYAPRKRIHPKRAEGKFRRFKWYVMAVTLWIYYVSPWLRWDRGEFAPDQAILIDLYHRRFYFFFIEIWPQEFYYVAGMLVMAGIGLFLVTSSVGRAWCGYTCPQTVWVDLFLVIERFVEGDRNARIRLDKEAWHNPPKLVKKVIKHAIWLIIAILTGGAWIFYFADAPTLFFKVISGEAASIAYGTIAVLAFTTYSLGGLMREQVCTYMCPWPRIQAAMLDENSLTVTYNDWRGEPRGRHAKKNIAAGKPQGDCIDCNACVAVCPMGIDIRDGQQLECITCALCIDACDSVMGKIGKPEGLISYATLSSYNNNMELAGVHEGRLNPALVRDEKGGFISAVQNTTLKTIFRPRTMLYFAVWSLIGLAMVFTLISRDRLELNVLHDRNPIAVTLSNGTIRNGYTIKILNMMPEPRTMRLSVEGLTAPNLFLAGTKAGEKDTLFVDTKSDQLKSIKVFITQNPKDLSAGKTQFTIKVQDIFGSETATYTAFFETGK